MRFKKTHIFLTTLLIATLSIQCKGKEEKKMTPPAPTAAAQTTTGPWQA
ncbi:MAG: hypothetical protein HY877_00250, partial [Deltaproteobacteria bacterium]|nr:hypothetical protein [Deltaproteobacteria bacterium]